MTYTKIHRAMVIATFTTLVPVNQALAQNFYVGGGISAIEYSESGISDDADLTALYGRVGTKFNDYLSAEIRAGFGIDDDEVEAFGVDIDTELENFYGVYLRGGIPTNSIAYPYVVLGYTRGEIEASVPGFSLSESESDVSYGVGLDLNLTDRVTLNLEYINYLDKDDVEIDGFNIGAVWLF